MRSYVKLKHIYLVLFILFRNVSACPSVCTCKWKNGKQTVECNFRDLLAIPEAIDSNTQVLEFSGNNLQMLTKEKFQKMSLINLQRIYLSRCRISTIDAKTFKGLTNLVELDLSHNLLTNLLPDTFVDCTSLMKLILVSNPLKSIKRNTFLHLQSLNSLDISRCEITAIEEGSFDALHSLEWLHLNGNKLTGLKGTMLLPQTLRAIDIQGNPWKCDCNIVDFHEWLTSFNVPRAEEPVCESPPRLSGKEIASITIEEFACLPNVSPTTFFLEVAEGKNISLLCHVQAVPEAQVSWLFQGRVLQNDTLIAPGMHLLYYFEEGSTDKRSELFIYNTNAEDNGTFVCTAENAAGISQANFTIKIVVKEDPIVIIVSFPIEYVMAVIAGASLLILLMIIITVILVFRCRRRQKRQAKREKTKEVALQYQQNPKDSIMNNDQRNNLRNSIEKHNITVATHQEQQTCHYVARSNEDLLRSSILLPVTVDRAKESPSSLRRYQQEQNPDLINDAESVERRRDGDGEDGIEVNYTETVCNGNSTQHIIQIAHPRTAGNFFSDVHLSPNCLIDPDGYPADYGLPKVPVRHQANDSFYRTLPYKRDSKRLSAANPTSRFIREAEFLTRNAHPAAYEHYCPGVRYTADGYMARLADTSGEVNQTYPPNSAPSSLPCCSATTIQWPHCVPANIHVLSSNSEFPNVTNVVSKKCVGAQTDRGDVDEQVGVSSGSCCVSTTTKTSVNPQHSSTEACQETLAESPDEGYEGEAAL